MLECRANIKKEVFYIPFSAAARCSVRESGLNSFSPSRSRVEIGLIAPFALDALYSTDLRQVQEPNHRRATALHRVFTAVYGTWGDGRTTAATAPTGSESTRTKARWRVHGMLYYHPYILRGTRALLPHTTHMIYCCNHQTHSRTLAVVSCPYEPVCRNYRRPNPHFVHITHFSGVL